MRRVGHWRYPLRAFRVPISLSGWASSPRAALAGILVVGFGFYARTIGYWFFGDDFWFLRASQSMPLGSYVVDAFNYRHPGHLTDLMYRPLYYMSFRGLYQLFGLHAWAYHLFGLIMHLASGVLLWQIAMKITRRAAVAHLACAIFLLHPSYAIAVAWVANNMAVISTFASLTSLWLFLLYLDGGVRRRSYYAASFLIFVGALLLHPETSYLLAVLMLSQALFRGQRVSDLRSVRAWGGFIPFILVELAFLLIQALARQANPFQSRFELGPHMIDNYARYIALALDPYRASPNLFFNDRLPLTSWRTLLPIATAVAAGATLLLFERRRPQAAMFAIAWFLLALLPLSTYADGAFARKLYSAGPALAIAVAIFAVFSWDFLSSRLPAGLTDPASAYCVFIVMVIFMGIRVHNMTEPFGQAADGYHILVSQVRESYPTLPRDSKLYLVGVPFPLRLRGPDSYGLASAMQLYYGNVEINMVTLPEQLASLPRPPAPNDVTFSYRCPPVCAATWKSKYPIWG